MKIMTDKIIVPAILTDKKEEFDHALSMCAQFCRYVQIDIMDGAFVPSKSVSLDVINQGVSPVPCEAHLMVTDPLSWIGPFKKFGAQRIIFHFEIKEDHREIIQRIKGAGLQAGIAVNPGTEFAGYKSLIPELDALLFMSVNPGFYGAAFIPEVLGKLHALRLSYPRLTIGIDGGVKLDNIEEVIASGPSYICVGSAIMKQNDPKEAYEKFSRYFERGSLR